MNATVAGLINCTQYPYIWVRRFSGVNSLTPIGRQAALAGFFFRFGAGPMLERYIGPSPMDSPYSLLFLELRLVGLGVVDAPALAVLALAFAGHGDDDPVALLLAHVRVSALPIAALGDL